MSSTTFVISVAPAPASTPTKVVQQSLAANGTTVFNTIQAAIDASVAGDIIEVRANTAGGAQSFSESVAFDNRNYASFLILRAREGDTIKVVTPPAVSRTSSEGAVPARICLLVRNSSRIKLEGDWEFGDGDGWSATDHRDRNQDRSWHICEGSNRLWLGDGRHRIKVYGGANWTGNLITYSCELIRLSNVDFMLHGTNNDLNDPGNAGSDWGDLLYCGCYQLVAEGCTFTKGGHEPCSQIGLKQVYRRCKFSGDWRGMGTGYPGSRAGAIISAWGLHKRIPSGARPTEFGPQLVEDCIYENVGASVDGLGNAFSKVESSHCILRFNLLWDAADGHGFPVEDYSETNVNHPLMCHFFQYNNTFLSVKGWVIASPENYAPLVHAESYSHWHFKNNVLKNLGPYIVPTQGSPRNFFRRRLGSAIGNGAYPNPWKGSEIAHNLAQFVDAASYENVECLSSSVGGGTADFADSTTWPENWHDNRRKTITFVAEGSPDSRTREGLALTAGMKADADFASAPLTTTTASGSSTTQVPVANARWFYDGWGMSELGEVGDRIAVGGVEVSIVTIDYEAGVLTVSSPISFPNNAAVQIARGGTVTAFKGAIQT